MTVSGLIISGIGIGLSQACYGSVQEVVEDGIVSKEEYLTSTKKVLESVDRLTELVDRLSVALAQKNVTVADVLRMEMPSERELADKRLFSATGDYITLARLTRIDGGFPPLPGPPEKKLAQRASKMQNSFGALP